MTVLELTKEKMLLRATNPVRADIITLVLAEAKAMAKTANREVAENDIVSSAKGLHKKLSKTLEEVRSSPNMFARTQQEIAELATFLPKALSPERTRATIEGIIITLDQTEKGNRKAILSKLKEVQGVDMAIANGIINEMLAKEKV